MDGMLSQDEINALLSGMDAPGESAAPPEEPAATPQPAAAPAPAPAANTGGPDDSLLTDIE